MVCDEESILRPKLTPCAFWYWPGSTTSKQDSGWGKSRKQRRQKSDVLVSLSSGLGPKPLLSSLYCLPWSLLLNEPRQLSEVNDLYLLCVCFLFIFFGFQAKASYLSGTASSPVVRTQILEERNVGIFCNVPLLRQQLWPQSKGASILRQPPQSTSLMATDMTTQFSGTEYIHFCS